MSINLKNKVAAWKKRKTGDVHNGRRLTSRGSLLKNVQLTSLCIPGLILLICFSYLPMYGLILAFKNYKFSDGIWGSEWIGFKNFEFLFKSDVLGRLLRNTLGYNLFFLIFNTIVTVVFAILLYEIKNKTFIKIIQTIVFLPFIISWVAAAYGLFANISDANGIMNGLIVRLGGEKIKFYATPELWPIIFLIMYLWKGMGYGIVIYYGNLLAIDSSYFEAAKLDGASRIQIMRHISWPFIRPIVTTFFILSLGKVFSSDFGMFLYLTKDSSMLYKVADVIDTYVLRALRTSGNVGMTTAINLLQSTVGFIVLLLANWLSKKVNDDNEGAVF